MKRCNLDTLVAEARREHERRRERHSITQDITETLRGFLGDYWNGDREASDDVRRAVRMMGAAVGLAVAVALFLWILIPPQHVPLIALVCSCIAWVRYALWKRGRRLVSQ